MSSPKVNTAIRNIPIIFPIHQPLIRSRVPEASIEIRAAPVEQLYPTDHPKACVSHPAPKMSQISEKLAAPHAQVSAVKHTTPPAIKHLSAALY